ncbi:MAG: hypothetical protein HQ541_16170 [Mariniphaga sp.]|nr:hypothetical protein [Mariniphaga sp.]
MSIKLRINYLQRIFSAYLSHNNSQLTFWHGIPETNKNATIDKIGQYYMPFSYKTNYPGPFDKNGIPLLDYRGKIGKQYNPIAIAQYGLGHYNLYKQTKNRQNLDISIKQADWLISNLETNKYGVKTWMHHFDWEYRDTLKSPWYSALAQGNGISLLTRIYIETKGEKYLKTAQQALKSLYISVENGGVLSTDENNDHWLEETIVDPPTHILNGFLWTIFGIWDYYLLTEDQEAKTLFDKCIKTLKDNLQKFDVGFWSLYEQSGTKMKMLASLFYHSLHIVQLKILYKITNESVFEEYAKKWEKYKKNWFYKKIALVYKIIFKLFYY